MNVGMPKHAPYLVRRCCLAVLAAAAVTEPSAARGQTSCTSATQVIGYSAQYETCTTTGTVGSSITEEVNGPQQNGLSYTNQGTVNNAVNGAGAVNLLANGTPIAQGGTYSYLFAPGITATNNGTITSSGPAKSGMYVVSTGAPGTADGTVDDPDTAPNNHYMGRDGGTVTVNQQGRINVETSGSAFQLGLGGLPQPLNAGIDARSYGGAGTADASGHSSNGPGGDGLRRQAAGVSLDRPRGRPLRVVVGDAAARAGPAAAHGWLFWRPLLRGRDADLPAAAGPRSRAARPR